MTTAPPPSHPSQNTTVAPPPGASLAMSAFILGYFIFEYHPATQDVSLPFHYVEWLLLSVAIVLGARATLEQIPRLLALALGIALIGTPALVAYSGQAGQGPASSYFMAAFTQGVYIFTAGIVAFVFYREATFLRIWKWIAHGAVVVAILGFFVAQAGISPLLAQHSANGSGLRLTGLLSEASAWAPIIPGLLFLALRKRSLPLIALSLTALALTRSPTVMLTTLMSAAVILLIHPGKRTLKTIVIGASTWALIELWPKVQDPALSSSLIATGNPIQVAAGRLLSGFQYIDTAGGTGQNVRYDGVQTTVTAAFEGGWELVGRGLGSSQVYFSTAFNEQTAFSYPVQIFFDFGIIGLTFFLILAIRTIWRMRGREVSYVFIPFFMASVINSAQGGASTKFIWLAIFSYVFTTVANQGRNRETPKPMQFREPLQTPSSP